ncbi:hypothetical protein K8R14_00095 [bacterium]|nr:hypothetical protein [bacterium]
MEEACQKLAELEKYIPDDTSNGLLYEYGRFLVDYLNPELNSKGFYFGCSLALYDLQRGVNGFTGEPIQSGFSHYPPIIFNLLRAEIPRIADAIFPEDFAQEVKQHIEEVEKSIYGTTPPEA